ncbi:hypothetical protein CPT32_28950 [Rhizobium sophoriradicis]|nr:hypothetical protein CPT32_28950 [Rhizobium sophoriradicis]
MIISIEAMHLLPHPFDMQAPVLLPGSPAGTTALLLPAVVRFFSKSLPHLLPRQAFSFWPPNRPSCLFSPVLECSCGPPLLGQARTKLLTPNLSYNYVTRRIPPQRKTV